MKQRLAVLAWMGWAGAGLLQADDSLPPALQAVHIEQRLGEQVPLELGFRDEAGAAIKLTAYFHDKPVILVLAYFRCPRLCSVVLNGLVDSLRNIPYGIGSDFTVVVVSFDSREQPELAAAKKAAYLEQYGRPGA